ncbi:MAG: divergent PAP2 family protein [Lachnospiraceae bacterium]|nr:divergent PAP2 family protein [Lachnospiraceae bacterium]
MDVMDLLNNHLLLAAACSWAVAQITKTIIHAIVYRTLDLKRLFGDGGMPSAHSATVTALATSAAIECGLDSPAFAVALLFAFVVMHDAMGVRLEASKHAKMLNELIDYLNADIPVETRLKEFLGHTPSQVVCGALLGLVVAIIFCFYI